jgi:hypothetical protein
VQRRKDPSGQRRRTAPVDQDKQLVQVDRRLRGELGRKRRLEARRLQPAPTPPAQRDAPRRSSRV